MNLNKRNYYSRKANREYLSVSQYKDFCGSLGKRGCEAHALAKLNGTYYEEPTTAMLIGSYVDSYFEGSLRSFKNHNPEIFNSRTGELKKDFQKAEDIIKVALNDSYFMKYMSGRKQVIMTAELFGVMWKIKIDSYIEGKGIVDLKVVEDLHKRFWVKDFGFTDFIQYWGYDFQLAIYQKVVEANTGLKLPCFIAGLSKQNVIDKEIIYVDQQYLDNALLGIEGNVKRIKDLKSNIIEPDSCGSCDFCISTKKLSHPIGLDLLIEV